VLSTCGVLSVFADVLTTTPGKAIVTLDDFAARKQISAAVRCHRLLLCLCRPSNNDLKHYYTKQVVQAQQASPLAHRAKLMTKYGLHLWPKL